MSSDLLEYVYTLQSQGAEYKWTCSMHVCLSMCDLLDFAGFNFSKNLHSILILVLNLLILS